MFASISKSFSAFSQRPFNFVWGSLLYLLFISIALLASFAVFMLYFVVVSALNMQVDMNSIPTMIAIAVSVLMFFFISDGLNATLAMTYRKAMSREKVSLVEFYRFGMRSAPKLFVITLIRDLIWLLLIAPFAILYVYVLVDYVYMDILSAFILLFITFVVHAIFTPALIAAGAGNMSIYGSLKQGFNLLRRKHINFLGNYIVFAFTWVLNFIPLVNLFTIFFAYPVAYSALIIMVEGGVSRPSADVQEE